MIHPYKPTVKESLEFATTSSQIEGESSTDAYRDHLQAWEYMRGLSSLSLTNMLECHKILQGTLRPDIAGRLRDCEVRVGYRICPSWTLVSGLLRDWLEKYSQKDSINSEDDAKLAHIAFEEIHPFEDGNGRVGRCILNWHRVNAGLPMLIIHPGEEQFAYYKWFAPANK